MKWTIEQEKAIYTKNCNLLVAAGAGSGKTAVLVERIINKIINDKVDIDRLLVVTFTNAAASEMRERIAESLYKSLENNPELQKQILLLNKASITTLHSFCLRVIRDNFFKVDLDPNFRVANDTECELLKLEAMEDTLEEIYEDESDEFTDVLNIYTDNRGDALLRDTLFGIYKFIQSSPFPYEWLDEKCEMYNVNNYTDFSETIWGEYLLNYAKDEVAGSIQELKEVTEEIFDCPDAQNYLITLQEDILNLKALEKVNTWDDMYNQISLLNFSTLKQARTAPDEIKELVKETREKIKKNVKSYLKENVFVSPSKEVFDDLKSSYKNLKVLSNLVKKFDEIYTTKKREKNILDFSDIEHICLKLLAENEDIRNMYKSKFDEILVDEYQDSNLIQEYIINTISNQKTFMVGDVKQSIYRFRQARPELFLDKYNSYSEDDDSSPNQKILLFKNFRSNKNIIDATNYIFKNIMSKEMGEIDYTEKEYLQFGADCYSNYGDNVEINLIENKLQEDEEIDDDISEKPQLEGKVIAKRISEIVGKLDVYDKHAKIVRKAEYKDIVILLRATTRYSDCFVDELSKKGIPVFCDSSLGYFDTNELQTITSLLKIIDNPIQDIPLIAVLRSQIGNFTADELVSIRTCDRNVPFYIAMQKSLASVDEKLTNKINNFLNMLNKWRDESKYLPLNEFIWKLYIETGYYDFVSLLPDGVKRQANLKLLIQRAEAYEKTSFKGLFNFINYIENIKNSNNDLENSKIVGENENVVRIMSIHKSKGLEFPIVFLSGTTRKFNMRDFQDKIVLHQELGFGTDIIKYDKRIQYPSIPKLALIQKSKVEALSEEMRILYVAMTRAREKLIITAMTPNIEKTYEKLSKAISSYRIGKATSLFDWIGLSVFDKNNDWNIKEWKYSDIINSEIESEEKYSTLIENIDKNFVKDESYEKIDSILSWKYPYAELINLPTKISISELKSRANRDAELDDIKELIDKPNFMKEDITTGASYGTTVHAILQAIDFKNPDIDFACRSINADEKIIISAKKQVVDFQNSELFRRIQKSDVVKKETSFNLNIPVNLVYELENEIDEKIMIQGIIDLYFIEDGEIVLVDYKTDNVKAEDELIKRYALQLKYYKMALQDITGLNVKESIIYSLKLKKEIRL